MTHFQAFVLAVIEGLTEYLPISSTGHMIVASHFMGIAEDSFVKQYEIIVQFGAIAAVVFVYWRKFLAGKDFYLKLIVGVLPAVVIGFSLRNKIEVWLGSVQIVAWALIVGGMILVFVDRLFPNEKESGSLESLSVKNAFLIGLCQCLALIPGTSRSAASIVGGMAVKLSRKAAAEFSFFLAVPTIAGASFLKVMKMSTLPDNEQMVQLVAGNVISFFVALIAIKSFIQIISKYGFKYFGLYRIVLGCTILAIV
jgi:undecaprenyl-diphosphatase